MTTPLDGLDDLPWEGMRVPGPGHDAGRIPSALREMATAEEGTTDIWGAALDVGRGYFGDRGDRYSEAAEHVLPFLIALCASPTAETASEAADLLRDLALAEPDEAETAAGNAGMLERVRALLLAGRPAYYAMLERPEPVVRRAGLELLHPVDAGAPHHAAALERARRAETDEETHRALGFHLDSLALNPDERGFGADLPLGPGLPGGEAGPRGTTSPLDGLDDIPWAGMRDEYAYERAARIPELLRKLDQGGPDTGAVRRDLEDTFVHGHSGCYLEPTEYLVPFFLRLCRSDDAAVVAAAVVLLCDVAGSDPFHTELEAGNVGLYERVEALLAAELPLYYRLLDHPDERVRGAAVELVVLVDGGAPRCREELERMWRTERTKRVRGVLAEEMRGLAGGSGADAP
ncbi:hypothetical protein ACIRBX_13225 [Kitasatospora sp. NPDC096147]|uniref:hypothetical protein n=1 Tax=Kitasatospora sp. NPDC096147 TaxID=3364093 RepID=UPI0037F82F6C